MPKLPVHTSTVVLPPKVKIYFLTEEDSAEYQRLRLESLQESPSAFLSLHENEVQLKEELFANHLQSNYHPPYFGFLGIFVDDQLVGNAQINESFFEKPQHISNIYTVYISP